MGKRYITDKQIHTGVLDIVSQMYAEDWRPDYIVGVTRGGLYESLYRHQNAHIGCSIT